MDAQAICYQSKVEKRSTVSLLNTPSMKMRIEKRPSSRLNFYVAFSFCQFGFDFRGLLLLIRKHPTATTCHLPQLLRSHMVWCIMVPNTYTSTPPLGRERGVYPNCTVGTNRERIGRYRTIVSITSRELLMTPQVHLLINDFKIRIVGTKFNILFYVERIERIVNTGTQEHRAAEK